MENIVIERGFEKTIVVEANYSPVQSVNGQVGFVTITPSGLGLGNINNTSDLDKPISNAAQIKFTEIDTNILYLSGTLNNSFNSLDSFVSSFQEDYLLSKAVNFRVELQSGIEVKNITYPELLFERPTLVNCEIENDVDDIIYMYKISNITNSGFKISFSDKLSNSGYYLNIQLGR